jgi:hypothetical protein
MTGISEGSSESYVPGGSLTDAAGVVDQDILA